MRWPTVRYAACLLGMGILLALCASGSWADAPEFDFHVPASAGDPATAAAMRDLAERLLPVYQDPDPDRYLANLSALQMIAGDYSSADVTRQSLRDRRRRADLKRPVGRSVIFDIYAYAKAIESENRVPFAQAFKRAFREVVRRLDDKDADTVTGWFGAPVAGFHDALKRAFDQQRTRDRIGEADAVPLLWAYLSFTAYREFAPWVAALDAEDDERRYVADTVDSLETRRGGPLVVRVIRPRSPAKRVPALLEFTLDESWNSAKESAARGYAGVVASAREPAHSALRVVPFQTEGDDARAVIEWIARQAWSDGRVAMVGEGHSGFAAWAAAREAPAALKAIATAAPTAPGVDFPMAGGVFWNSGFRWSLEMTNTDRSLDAALKDDAAWRALDLRWYASGRRYRDLGLLYGTPNPLFLRWLNHPSYDRFWQRMIPYEKQFAGIHIPVLTLTGYYAASEPGALYYFAQHLKYNPRADHTLVIGPYDDAGLRHPGPSSTVAGYQADAAAAVDFEDLRYQWLDHVFKGGAMPALTTARVNYEVMGANEWRHAPSLEALDGALRRFYLDVKPAGIGRALSAHKPARLQFLEQRLDYTDRSDADRVPTGEITVKSPVTHNGLAFVSEPLEKGAEVSGRFAGRLDFTVNKMDLDLALSLYEQTAAGDYVRLFSPAYEFRASYVRDRVHRQLLEAGVRRQLAFTSERLTSRRLKPGSRLVVVLALAKRPDRELNYGTGKDVSEESVSDGGIPLTVRWYSDSYIDVPMGR